MVPIDVFLLSLFACAIGIGLGVSLAANFISMLSGVSEYLQGVEVERARLSPATLLVGAGVGLLAGMAGCVGPALRASGRAPLDRLRPLASPRAKRVRSRRAPVLLGAAWLSIWMPLLPLPPVIRLPAIFVLGLLFTGALARHLLPAFILRIRPLLESRASAVGRLAGASLLARPLPSGVTVATLTGVVAGLTLVSIVVGSISATLDEWAAGQYRGGILITAGNPLAGRGRTPVRKETLEIIRGTPGVRAVFDHYTTNILYQGKEVFLGGSSMDVMAEYGDLPALDMSGAELAHALVGGQVAVSDQFAARFSVARGDDLILHTPKGRRSFRVAGVMRDYAGPSGSLNVDIAVYDELWSREGSTHLVLWTAGPVEPVLREIRKRVGDGQDLFFIHGDQLERHASSVIGQFTRALDVVELLMALLGGVAVMNLLLGAVLEKRRELSLLRAAGATSGQLRAVVLLDAAIVSGIGTAAGVSLGVICAYPLVTQIVRDAFSWWIVFSLDASALLRISIASMALAVLAGLYPAWLTSRLSPREALAPE